MAKEFEILDSLVQSQKEFMETWMTTQKELWERMSESSRKMQEAMLSPLCSPQSGNSGDMEGAQKEAFNVYNTMVETMVNTSKVYTDEVIRMQEAWRHTIDKQMEIGRRMNTNIFEMGRRTAEEAVRRAQTSSEGEQAA
jgi:hypothetical protein